MLNRTAIVAALTFCLAGGTIACGGDEAADAPTVSGNPSRNVTQGGPQDIGEFRRVVAAGSVPELKLLDPVGFFAEHAIDLPPADCGDPICVHPMLSVMPRFDGGNWSMAFVGLNTALDPATLPRSPRHLILVIEDTQRRRPTLQTFADIADVLTPALKPEDRVSVILAAEQSRLIADSLPREELANLELNPFPGFGIDLYFALSTARDVALATDDGLADRILLITSGLTDTGIAQIDQFADLAQNLAENDVGISTIGLSADYRGDIPMLLSDLGGGNYYYATSRNDLHDALTVESETAFVPLARNLTLSVQARPGYHIGRIYGARRASVYEDEALLGSPVLYMGAREGASDISSGRRGGGGGWFVELRADVLPGEGVAEPADAFVLSASYTDAQSGTPISQTRTLVTPLGVGQNPDPTSPFFSDPERGKAFMMLNMYLALSGAISLYEAGDCGRALGVRDMMQRSYQYWTDAYQDPDIDADWQLLQQLTTVIDTSCEALVVEPVELDMGCGFL